MVEVSFNALSETFFPSSGRHANSGPSPKYVNHIQGVVNMIMGDHASVDIES